MSLYQRILCAIDFSPTSDKALAVAQRLASESGAELLLVHAFDLPEKFTMQGQTHPHDPAVEQQLQALSVDPKLKVQRLLHAGPSGHVVCWVAQERSCDLIVVGTHGRTGLKSVLLGSVAQQVLQHAPCPVLVVRNRAADEAPLPEPHVVPLKPPRFM
ncbi:MAG: universal stress protein [Planctomycetaceae bacterium]|nr:universal stress protein [Planctomycetaceae bacterium]